MTVDLRPGRGRFRTAADGRETWRSFSFGAHYDPANVSFGPLLALNDERLAPGAGYDTHAHHGVELVTWVLKGSLVHEDSSGARDVLPAGTVQVHTTGSGIEHSEHAGPGPGSTRFVQAWLRPDDEDAPPRRRTVSAADLLGPELAAVASSDGRAPLGLGACDATLWAAQLRPGDTVLLPASALVHVFLATGVLEVPGVGQLRDGDAARMTDEPDRRVVATTGSLLIVWSFARR